MLFYAKIPTKLRICLLLALLLIFFALCSQWLTPNDPYAQDLSKALQPPSSTFLFGTDRYGRDLLSRVMVGSTISVFSALGIVLTTSVAGSILGLLCGYYEGKLDKASTLIANSVLAIPSLILAIAIAGVIGGGLSGALLALCWTGWPKYQHLMRSTVLRIKQEPYIRIAPLYGYSKRQIIWQQLLPVALPPILLMAAMDMGTVLLELAGLSFLGLSAPPPAAEWGLMMSDGRSMLQLAPWSIAAPAIALFITVSIFNLLGDTYKDYLEDNKQKGGSQ